MDRKEMQNTRLYLLAAFLVLALVVYLFVLYDVQVIHYEDYADQAIRSIVRREKVEASRGIITDRNGKPLVSNRSTYDLTFDATLLSPKDDSNEAILRLVQLCQEKGVAWSDSLPISRLSPYSYTVDQMDSQQRRPWDSICSVIRIWSPPRSPNPRRVRNLSPRKPLPRRSGRRICLSGSLPPI